MNFKSKTNLQIILLGDSFDYLVGFIKASIERNMKLIKLINQLSKTHEIIIFEGNHDFFLAKLFPRTLVIDFKNQPLHLSYKDKIISLSHGHKDFNFDNMSLYKILFNKTFLFSMHYLTLNNFFGWIDKLLYNKYSKKKYAKKALNLKKIIAKKLNIFYKKSNLILEGHYHQGKAFKIQDRYYINVVAFLTKQEYLYFDAKIMQFKKAI